MSEQDKIQAEQLILSAQQLESIGTANLPSITATIADPELWEPISDMSNLQLEDGQIPSKQDWASRNTQMWACRNALADKHNEFAHSFAAHDTYRCHFCKTQCVDKPSLDIHLVGKNHLRNYSKLMLKAAY